MSDHPFDKWVTTYAKAQAAGQDQAWPSEVLVRLFKGNYVPGMAATNLSGKRVLDVGFGNGNNGVFFAHLGMQVAGTEVDEALCKSATQRLEQLGLTGDFRVGTNRNLPFDNDSFDFLVSWNVLHYEDCEEHIQAAIAEYARVLRPGGRIFISTTGPEHKILADAQSLGCHRYRIGRPDDFRQGQTFFYFDNPYYIHYYFDPHFRDVQVGRINDHLFSDRLDWFLITGVKP
ncbi:MAG: class I SAM-dependent methyltransferase [Magnetococcales bacterium]|nr:class I SAM-dependent methyltransferase [Magnetococcales bacterium]NGZ27889.1 class I SAM-dependent methyltransferase [Magnetococcales bacterium]